jgi:hypothetical protein
MCMHRAIGVKSVRRKSWGTQQHDLLFFDEAHTLRRIATPRIEHEHGDTKHNSCAAQPVCALHWE